MIRETITEDLKTLEGVIDSTDLFPYEMLGPMIQPFLESGEKDSIWLTLCDPDPVGVAYSVAEKMTEGTWNMLLIAVHADHQNSGRGADLVSHMEEVLRSREARLVIVETSSLDEYSQARRFYSKLGYTEEGRIRDFYSDGDDKVIFRKSLLG